MSFLSQTSTRRADASPMLVLVIVCAGVVLASLDLFIVNVALPDIARDLHERSLGDLSWVLNAYAIVYAAMLVLSAACQRAGGARTASCSASSSSPPPPPPAAPPRASPCSSRSASSRPPARRC